MQRRARAPDRHRRRPARLRRRLHAPREPPSRGCARGASARSARSRPRSPTTCRRRRRIRAGGGAGGARRSRRAAAQAVQDGRDAERQRTGRRRGQRIRNNRAGSGVRITEMVLAIVFAFVAGLITAVSPCVLPVLPIVLAGGRRREPAPAVRDHRRPRALLPRLDSLRDAGFSTGSACRRICCGTSRSRCSS